jgi:hypothetical protein
MSKDILDNSIISTCDVSLLQSGGCGKPNTTLPSRQTAGGAARRNAGPSLVCHVHQRLGLLRDYHQMRAMIWMVGLLALATSLDSSLYNGFYTRNIVRMFSDMAIGFGFG